MKKKTIAIVILSTLICGTISTPINKTFAENITIENNIEDLERTEGLISKCYLSVSNSNSQLRLIANTTAYAQMKYIGIRQISIQRSSDGVNWTTVSTPADMLTQDSSESNIDTSFSVSSGYYYRIVCAHYARDYSVLPSWQIEPNISNSVWI